MRVGSASVLRVSDGPDLNPHNLLNILLHHLEVPVAFIPGSLLLGGLAWWLAPRRGWAQTPAVLAGCALALALALTVVRPFGHFSVGGFNPLTTLRECSVGSMSLRHLYEQLNVAMLVPFALFGTLASVARCSSWHPARWSVGSRSSSRALLVAASARSAIWCTTPLEVSSARCWPWWCCGGERGDRPALPQNSEPVQDHRVDHRYGHRASTSSISAAVGRDG